MATRTRPSPPPRSCKAAPSVLHCAVVVCSDLDPVGDAAPDPGLAGVDRSVSVAEAGPALAALHSVQSGEAEEALQPHHHLLLLLLLSSHMARQQVSAAGIKHNTVAIAALQTLSIAGVFEFCI